jgi:hypothetical protein
MHIRARFVLPHLTSHHNTCCPSGVRPPTQIKERSNKDSSNKQQRQRASWETQAIALHSRVGAETGLHVQHTACRHEHTHTHSRARLCVNGAPPAVAPCCCRASGTPQLGLGHSTGECPLDSHCQCNDGTHTPAHVMTPTPRQTPGDRRPGPTTHKSKRERQRDSQAVAAQARGPPGLCPAGHP